MSKMSKMYEGTFTDYESRKNKEHKKYQDGKIVSYKDAEHKLDGEFIEYFCGGKLSIYCFYKDGKLDGEFKKYRNDGKTLLIHCYYKNGKIEGEYFNYNNDGSVHKYFYIVKGFTSDWCIINENKIKYKIKNHVSFRKSFLYVKEYLKYRVKITYLNNIGEILTKDLSNIIYKYKMFDN